MLIALTIIIICSLLVLLFEASPRYRRWSGYAAMAGIGLGLLAHIIGEVFGGEATFRIVQWPPALARLGEPVYRSDALSAALGTWCLLLGLVCLWPAGRDPKSATGGRKTGKTRAQPVPSPAVAIWRLPVGMLIIAVLYSLVHTWNLRIYATQTLFVAMLAWALGNAPERDGADHRPSLFTRHSSLATFHALGSVFLLASVLLLGRVTGGDYSLERLPIPALTAWPLALLLVAVALWVGCAPFTGWSLRGYSGKDALLMQTLAAGIPVVALLLRLESTIASQVIGPMPETWAAFTGALAWVGGLTALVAAAGMVVAAGMPTWWPLSAAHSMGLVVWALALNTPAGRISALALLFAWGAARATFELSGEVKVAVPVPGSLNERGAASVAAFSLAAAPLPVGFVGVWLLATTLALAGRASEAVAVVGAAILAACGSALHFSRAALPGTGQATRRPDLRALIRENRADILRLAIAWAAALLLLVGGVLPGLWLPVVANMAGATIITISQAWWGMEITAGRAMAELPIVLIAAGALFLASIAWLATRRAGAVAEARTADLLLPAARKRLEKLDGGRSAAPRPPAGTLLPAPTPALWLSLLWIEDGLKRLGTLIVDWCGAIGLIVARLEGRYYLPLALVLALVAVLALAR